MNCYCVTIYAFITAASFLFLVINWCFLLDTKTTTVFDMSLDSASAYGQMILPMLLVFLLSAATWAWITIAARKGSKMASKAVTYVFG
jgi:hypothetical protein